MYKTLSLDEVVRLKPSFFKNLNQVLQQLRYPNVKTFVGSFKPYEKELVLLKDGAPFFSVEVGQDQVIFRSDPDGVQLSLPKTALVDLHQKLVKFGGLGSWGSESIFSVLEQRFRQDQSLRQIKNKPYVVFDVETLGNISNLKNAQYELGYALLSTDDHSSSIKYRFVSQQSLKKFVDFLLDFDGWVVGFNNIAFDNPVVVYAAGYGDEEVKKINQKSLDLFLVVWRLTWRRLGLDKVASALVGIKKTLSSGLEGEKLLRQYKQTGDQKLLQKVKNYCKNDVRMTLGLLLYFLEFGKFSLDGKDYTFDVDRLLEMGGEWETKASKPKVQQQTLFSF